MERSDMLKRTTPPDTCQNSLIDIEKEQVSINNDRINLLSELKHLKPPESTKSTVYKWFESVKQLSQKLKDANTIYLNTLRQNYEKSNQEIINQIEFTLVYPNCLRNFR